MTQKAICKGIEFNFGHVKFNVNCYLAAAVEDYKFKRISPEGNQLKNKTVDEKSENPYKTSQGYLGIVLSNGETVLFTDEEVEEYRGGQQGFFVDHFVPESSIDSVYYGEKTYFLKPDKGSESAFCAFALALAKSDGRVGIGKWRTPTREHLIVVRPYKNGIIIQQLFYNNEVREYNGSMENVPQEDIDSTLKLIQTKTVDKFDLSKIKNEQTQRISKAIEMKLKKPSDRQKKIIQIFESARDSIN